MIQKLKLHLQPSFQAISQIAVTNSPSWFRKFVVDAQHSITAAFVMICRWVASHRILVSLSAVVTAASFSIFTLFWQPSVQYNFSSVSACNSKLVIFPDLHKITKNPGYDVWLNKKLSLGRLNLLSREMCVTPMDPLPENSVQTLKFSFMGLGLAEHKINIQTARYPILTTDNLSNSVYANSDITFSIDKDDEIFEYRLHANDKNSACDMKQGTVSCSLESLNLVQGAEYKVIVYRYFNGQRVDQAYSGTLKTASAVEIVDSYPISGSTVYDNISEIVLSADKKLRRYENILLTKLGETEETIGLRAQIKGSQLVISATDTLPRRSSFRLSVGQVYSEEGGGLNKPYIMEFHTSGGPVVTGQSIRSHSVDLGSVIYINFDQILATNQNIESKITLTKNGAQVPISVRIFDKRVRIVPSGLDRCTDYSLHVNNQVASPLGVVGDSGYTFNFRTRCAIVSVIGYSAGGRPIYAYKFGNGSSKVVFVGAMHGNEISGMRTLNAWMDELEKNPGRIPSHRSVIIISNSNPDAVINGTRTNSNGVDLNRNFPASDWTSGVYMPGGIYSPTGGGGSPLSEPESAALASYIKSIAPRLVITYHSSAGVVIGNNSGDSNSLAALYAQKARYSHAYDSQADEIFSYPTTGEFEDWLHDKLGIPAILVENFSMSSNELSRNRDALWAMVEIP